MKREIKDALISIGLTSFQAELYVAVLKNPLASVLDLARVTSKNRQQIYSDAEVLVSKGLLERTSKNKRKYLASASDKIIMLARENQQKAQDDLEKILGLVPELEKFAGDYMTQISTKFYEGELQMKEAYERELSVAKNTEVLTLVGEIEETFKMFPEEYWDKWNRKFVKNGSSSKMIVHDTSMARQTAMYDKKYHRKTRYIGGFGLKINIDVFGNNVLLASFRDKFAIWIESEIVAGSYRMMFETLWNIAKS